jgi:hypothetical protein
MSSPALIQHDVHGTGREVVRGGWGIYTDFGYTANVLTAPSMPAGQPIFVASAPAGIRRPDGPSARIRLDHAPKTWSIPIFRRSPAR